jgi:glucosamine--fructose-6-phosphate aminotransferase (isomerizing)
MEQPDAVRRTIEPFITNGRVDLSSVLSRINKVARQGVYSCVRRPPMWESSPNTTSKSSRESPSRSFWPPSSVYCDPIIDENTLVVLISQSGETADTLEALNEAKKLGARTLSIVNVESSPSPRRRTT